MNITFHGLIIPLILTENNMLQLFVTKPPDLKFEKYNQSTESNSCNLHYIAEQLTYSRIGQIV